MQWLAPIGAYPPPVELPLHASDHNHGRTWITWLARAITRTAPSVVPVDGRKTVLLDADAAADALVAARKEWIAGQAQYHGLRARAMHDLESGLENYARGLLWAVILLAFGAMTLEVLMKQHLLPHGAHTYAAVMGAAAAILPAFMAAFHGLAFQSEAKRLAVRYGAMHEALVAQYTQIGRDVDDLRRTKPADAVTRVRTVLRNIAADTIREASDWKVFYPVHAIHAG